MVGSVELAAYLDPMPFTAFCPHSFLPLTIHQFILPFLPSQIPISSCSLVFVFSVAQGTGKKGSLKERAAYYYVFPFPFLEGFSEEMEIGSNQIKEFQLGCFTFNLSWYSWEQVLVWYDEIKAEAYHQQKRREETQYSG